MACCRIALFSTLIGCLLVRGVSIECSQGQGRDGDCMASSSDMSALLQSRINVDEYFQVDDDVEEYDAEEDVDEEDDDDDYDGEDYGSGGQDGEDEDEQEEENENMINFIYSEHDNNNAEPEVDPMADMLEDDMEDDMDQDPEDTILFEGEDLVPPTCVAEEALRETLKGVVKAANSVRFVFHDMTDFNNLALKNADSGKWEPIDGSYGGVDGCVYADLKEVKGKRVLNAERNRNINNGYVWAKQLCAYICGKSWPTGMAGTTLCQSKASCEVDITVLGTLAAIENAAGPVMDMSWGREKGNCTGPIVTPFTKSKSAAATYQTKPALNKGPTLTGIDDPDSFRTVFQNMGFDAIDQVALMGGGHSFGQVQVCAGGLNGVERGPFCKQASKVDLKMGDGSAWRVPTQPWGDGGVWDRTPMTFDNDYFKLFADEVFDHKDDCCGKVKKGGCHRKGTPVSITSRATTGLATKWKKIDGGICAISWCRSDRKGRTHMKSVKAWTMVNGSWPGFAKSRKHGLQKRMIRVAGDWALLKGADTLAKVKEFAKDQDAFFTAFSVAWGKVIGKTHSTLSACTGEKDPAAVKQAMDTLFPLKVRQNKGLRGVFPLDWCRRKGRC